MKDLNYPYDLKTPVYKFACPLCNKTGQTYAIPDTAKQLRCRFCGRCYVIKELKAMITSPLVNTGMTLGDMEGTRVSIDIDAPYRKAVAVQREYLEGVVG